MWKDSETELDFLDYDYLICLMHNKSVTKRNQKV